LFLSRFVPIRGGGSPVTAAPEPVKEVPQWR
jgi:hypothetical protein